MPAVEQSDPSCSHRGHDGDSNAGAAHGRGQPQSTSDLKRKGSLFELPDFSLFQLLQAADDKKLKLSKVDFFRDALRIQHSILPTILPSVLGITLWALVIYSADTFYGRQWNTSSAIVGPLSVVVSLLLVFRTGTCFEKWHEARKIWAQAEAEARGLARWVWVNVDLRVPAVGQEAGTKRRKELGSDADGSGSRDTLPSSYGTDKSSLAAARQEDLTATSQAAQVYARRLRKKRRAIRLLGLFFTALAHELRDEHGADWADYDGVLTDEDRCRWQSWHVDAGAREAGEAGERSDGYDVSTLRSLAPESMGTAKSMRRRGGAAGNGALDGDAGRQEQQHREPDVEAATTPSDASGETTPLLKPHHSSSAPPTQRRSTCPPLSATHTLSSLGLCIYSLQQLTHYLGAARRAGMLEQAGPAGFNAANTLLVQLGTAHASLHRIKSAAIPVAYGIHLKQCTAAYLLALPLTLVTELGWKMIPFVTLVAVTLLGVVGINGELEVPFGDDASDHHLALFCAAFRSEIEWMLARVPEGLGDVEEVCG